MGAKDAETLQKCENFCEENPECNAFTYLKGPQNERHFTQEQNGTCNLKGSALKNVAHPGAVSGRKKEHCNLSPGQFKVGKYGVI